MQRNIASGRGYERLTEDVIATPRRMLPVVLAMALGLSALALAPALAVQVDRGRVDGHGHDEEGGEEAEELHGVCVCSREVAG